MTPQNLVILCEDSGKITLQAASWGDGGEILRGVLVSSKQSCFKSAGLEISAQSLFCSYILLT